MLCSKRLILRPLAAEDVFWIYRGISTPEITQWLNTPPWPYALDHAQEYVRMFGGKPDTLAIVADRPVGVVALHVDTAGSLGFWLDQAAWGKGYMTEALATLLDHHFSTTDLPVGSGWLRGNDASARVHHKHGFQFVEHTMEHSNFHGGDMPLERVVLTARGYANNRRQIGVTP